MRTALQQATLLPPPPYRDHRPIPQPLRPVIEPRIEGDNTARIFFRRDDGKLDGSIPLRFLASILNLELRQTETGLEFRCGKDRPASIQLTLRDGWEFVEAESPDLRVRLRWADAKQGVIQGESEENVPRPADPPLLFRTPTERDEARQAITRRLAEEAAPRSVSQGTVRLLQLVSRAEADLAELRRLSKETLQFDGTCWPLSEGYGASVRWRDWEAIETLSWRLTRLDEALRDWLGAGASNGEKASAGTPLQQARAAARALRSLVAQYRAEGMWLQEGLEAPWSPNRDPVLEFLTQATANLSGETESRSLQEQSTHYQELQAREKLVFSRIAEPSFWPGRRKVERRDTLLEQTVEVRQSTFVFRLPLTEVPEDVSVAVINADARRAFKREADYLLVEIPRGWLKDGALLLRKKLADGSELEATARAVQPDPYRRSGNDLKIGPWRAVEP